jgi:hypothetical protein
MMVAPLLCAYAIGVRSSRALERRRREDIAVRVVCANTTPDHATIARFGGDDDERLAALVTEVLGLCAEAGLVAVGTIALDSTRLEADASGDKSLSYRRLAEQLLAGADALDSAADERYGSARGDEPPPELRAPGAPIERLRAAKRRLDERREAERRARADYLARRRARERAAAAAGGQRSGRPPRGGRKRPPARVDPGDPDPRPERTHRGFSPGSNAQAVTAAGPIVIAADLLPQSTDARQLEPLVGAARAELERARVGAKPEVVVADAGDWNGAQLAALERTGIEVLVPPYEGERLERRGGRYDAMRRELGTERGRARWRRRQQPVEPVFAEPKVTPGAKRFRRRG